MKSTGIEGEIHGRQSGATTYDMVRHGWHADSGRTGGRLTKQRSMGALSSSLSLCAATEDGDEWETEGN